MSQLVYARKYVKAGFSVIPIRAKGKLPMGPWKEFQTRKPTDEELVRWFDGKDVNIGIVTGQISNLAVIDCDSDSALELAKNNGLPDCPVSKTGRGYQFFYNYEPGIRNFQKRDDLPGIDLRGEGGYVVAPPSVHPTGAIYSWQKWCSKRVSMPKWVLATKNKSEKTPIQDLYTGAPVGTRNDTLTRLAGTWAKKLPFQEVLKMAREWNLGLSEPLPELELYRTVDSVWNLEQRNHPKPIAAKEIGECEIVYISNLHSPIQALYEQGIRRGVSPGWLGLEDYYTVRPGEWTLVTGIPGHGKTEFLDNLLVNLAAKSDWKFGIFSAENLPHERHAASLIEKYTGKPFQDGYRFRLNGEELTQGIKFVSDHFFFLNPDEEVQSIDRLLALGKMLVAKHGINGLLIDPWNELDHSRPNGMTETEYISTALTKLRRFARTNKIHIWVVAHPAKLLRNKSDGTYPVPNPYDVSGSAHWRNKADNALCVWREPTKPDSATQVHIQKIRFREVGKVGMVELFYEFGTGKYKEQKIY